MALGVTLSPSWEQAVVWGPGSWTHGSPRGYGSPPYGQVAPGNARTWPALRSLLHRNLVLKTHQPARWGQLQGMQEAGNGSIHDILSGVHSHPAIPRPHAVEVGEGRPCPQEPTLLEHQEGLRLSSGGWGVPQIIGGAEGLC